MYFILLGKEAIWDKFKKIVKIISKCKLERKRKIRNG
jgi:hypothetical protein